MHAKKLAEKHPGWVVVHVGEALRTEIKNRTVEDRWKMVKNLVTGGELAPEVGLINLGMVEFGLFLDFYSGLVICIRNCSIHKYPVLTYIVAVCQVTSLVCLTL